MGSPQVWILNFEAEFEFAQGAKFNADGPLGKRLDALRTRQAHRLLRPGDRLLSMDAAGGAAAISKGEFAGYEGRAWCATPRALEALRRAGARVPAAPRFEVLQGVNDRAFNAALGQTLPGACFSTDLQEIEVRLSQASPSGNWLCKRSFGVSGRGQRRVRPGEVGQAERAWLEASLRLGGLQIEPLVHIEVEFSSHGVLSQEGECELGEPCVMACDEYGAWVETREAGDGEITSQEREALGAEASRAADALTRAGYFGPFGVDGFRWVDGNGNRRLQARSEINGRHTLGWRVSFPDR